MIAMRTPGIPSPDTNPYRSLSWSSAEAGSLKICRIRRKFSKPVGAGSGVGMKIVFHILITL
jgi:hypothetical protein